MIADPFGLGVLLYGSRPTRTWETLTAALWAVGPLDEREWALAHEGCSISTFCRNPLHPGPCKGWKKSLGVNAPGALKAIEAARREKLAARRAATSEAKSAAEKKLTHAQLQSPLHAKKATIKHANVLLGKDEGKADAKASKVILNKTEIKKYSKIKAAQVNSIRTKRGLEEDPGLEDRLAEAFAKDNADGRDEHYRAALKVSAASLGAQLAEKHCKKGDGDCDGKAYEGLRDHLTTAAEFALITGNDEDIDGVLQDYKDGNLTLVEAPPAKAKIPAGAKAKALAEGAPSPGAKKPEPSAAQLAAEKMAYNYSASVPKKIETYAALSPEEFKNLPGTTQTAIKDSLKSIYQYNPKLRKEVAGVLVNFTEGKAQESWKKAADHPGYTDRMEKVGKYALKGPQASSTLSASLNEKLATYDALTGDEWNNLHPQERAFVLGELDGITGQKFGKAKADKAKALKAKLESLKPTPAPPAPAGPEVPPGGKPVPELSTSAKRAINLASNWKNDNLHHKDFIFSAKKINKEEFDSLPEADQKSLKARAELLSGGVGSTSYDAKVVLSKWNGTYQPPTGSTDLPQHIADTKTHLAGGKPKSLLPTSMLYAQVSKSSWEKHFSKEERKKAHDTLVGIHAGMSDGATDKPGVEATIKDLEEIDPELKAAEPGAPTPAGLPEGATPKKLTLKQAGLQPGDKVWLHTHNGGGGVDTGSKAKPGDKPVLVTVKAEKNASYGGAKGTVSYTLVGPDGKDINGGSAAAKYWISPVDGPEFGGEPKPTGTPDLGAPGKLNAKQTKALEVAKNGDGNATSDAEALDAYGALSKEDFDGLDQADKDAIISDLESIQNLVGGPEGDQAEMIQAKLAGAGKPPAAPAAPPVGKLAEDVSPEAKVASDYAHGFKSGTAKQKLPAYEKLSGDEFAQLAPNTQKLILADLKSIEGKFLAPAKKKQASDHFNYLSTFMGGGAGAGGGGNPAVSTPEEKLAEGAAAAKEIANLTKPTFAGPTYPDALAQGLVHQAGASGHDKAAEVVAATLANDALEKLSFLHEDPFGNPMFLPQSLSAALPSLKADIAKKLKGEPGPTPHYDALKKALILGDIGDAATFMTNAGAAPSPAHVGGGAGTGGAATQLGTYQPSGIDTWKVTKSEADDGVLFSAFKSAHKGSVLSHSHEDIYNNLLAVAQHYAGSDASGEFGDTFPSDLSVLQVAKAVDLKLAKAKGVDNQNVLQKKMYDWSQTAAGKKYIAEHQTAGAKWADNLAGAGAGHAEAAKVGLKIGAPVGQRVQKLTPSKNGKAPKFDASKAPDEFRPLTWQEITSSQQEHMDANSANWTPGQAESLANYTTGAYYELNSYLRGKDSSGQPVNTISSLGLERIALIQNGMRPMQQDTLLKRGTGWEFVPPEYRNPTDIMKLVGKTVDDPAFMSTTVGGEGGEFTAKPVRLEVEAPKGTPSAFVKHISHNAGENEVVLAAGTRFRIISVTPGESLQEYDGKTPTVIRVRVVG